LVARDLLERDGGLRAMYDKMMRLGISPREYK
jgi:hypothetical protein